MNRIIPTIISLVLLAMPVSAQSGLIPDIFGGGGSAACKKKCDKVKKDCQKEIDRLKRACSMTGNTLICDNARNNGCKASERYCKAMEQVDFGDSKCDPPSPNPPGPPGGGGSGEPHYRTFDGLAYDLQSAGDFPLVETTDQRFAVHVRMVPVHAMTSAQSAVGINIDGTIIKYDHRDREWIIIDRGRRVPWARASAGPLNGIVMGERSQGRIVIVKPGVGIVQVHIFSGHIDVEVNLLGDQTTRGLLGNQNGSAQDDLIIPDGVDLWEWLHTDYAEEIRFTENSRLLPYRDGETALTFAIEGHPNRPARATLAALESARLFCESQDFSEPWFSMCVHDVAITGDQDYAAGLSRREVPGLIYAEAGTPSAFQEIRNWLRTGTEPGFTRASDLVRNSGDVRGIEADRDDAFDLVDLKTWTASAIGGGADKKWIIADDANSVRVNDNTRYPLFLLSEPIEGAYRFKTTVRVDAPQKDHLGFVLGLQSIGGAGEEVQFILLDWKHSDARYRGVPAPEGWRLSAFKGRLPETLDRASLIERFWGHSDTSLISPLTEITGTGTGWEFGETYSIEIAYSASDISLSVDGDLILEARGDFPKSGAVGLYSYSQSNLEFGQVRLQKD